MGAAHDEELIRDVWRRWNEGEREPDSATFTADLEIHSALAGKRYHGAAGIREWQAEIDEQFDAWRLEIDELHQLAPGAYIGHGGIHARGRHSGVDLDEPASWLIDLRDGRIHRLRNFIGAQARSTAEREGGGA